MTTALGSRRATRRFIRDAYTCRAYFYIQSEHCISIFRERDRSRDRHGRRRLRVATRTGNCRNFDASSILDVSPTRADAPRLTPGCRDERTRTGRSVFARPLPSRFQLRCLVDSVPRYRGKLAFDRSRDVRSRLIRLFLRRREMTCKTTKGTNGRRPNALSGGGGG